MDLVHLSTDSHTDEHATNNGNSLEAMDEWLVSIDEDIDAVSGSPHPPSPLREEAKARETILAAPYRPPSISIKGRASELLPSSMQQTAFDSQSHSEAAPLPSAPSSPEKPKSQKSPPSQGQPLDLPPHLAGLGPSRSSSPPSSYVSATNGSHVSSQPSTRVTLGTAAAGWKFEQRSKVFAREYTIDPKRGRNSHPSILRQGNALQMQTNLNGSRRPVHPGGIPPTRGQTFQPRPAPGGMQPRPGILLNHAPGPSPPMHHNHMERNVNVEIRISNVPLACTKDQLYSVLGDSALHRAPFSTRERKLNFW